LFHRQGPVFRREAEAICIGKNVERGISLALGSNSNQAAFMLCYLITIEGGRRTKSTTLPLWERLIHHRHINMKTKTRWKGSWFMRTRRTG